MADCFFHTGRPSVTRCKQCGRPLCGECRMVKPEGIFCSDKCFETFSVFARRAEELEAKRGKTSGMNAFVKLVIFIVVMAVIYVVVRRFVK